MHDPFCCQPSQRQRVPREASRDSSPHHNEDDMIKSLSGSAEHTWQLQSDEVQEMHSVGKGEGQQTRCRGESKSEGIGASPPIIERNE